MWVLLASCFTREFARLISQDKFLPSGILEGILKFPVSRIIWKQFLLWGGKQGDRNVKKRDEIYKKMTDLKINIPLRDIEKRQELFADYAIKIWKL